MIINLPKDLAKQTTHRYGPNSFKLHRLPIPRPGQVCVCLGLRVSVRRGRIRDGPALEKRPECSTLPIDVSFCDID